MADVEPEPGELVVHYPPLNRQFGVRPVGVVVFAPLLAIYTAGCLWLLFLAVNQLMVLAGWGWGNLILIRHETRWLPVAGSALAWLAVSSLFLWFTTRAYLLWWRRLRRTWMLRLTPTGFEVNDRIFVPRRYGWHQVNQFMLVAERGQTRNAVVDPPKTWFDAFKASQGRRPRFYVGFECTPGHHAGAPRLFGGLVSRDGTRADGVITGHWDRSLFDVVNLLNDWLDHYRGPR